MSSQAIVKAIFPPTRCSPPDSRKFSGSFPLILQFLSGFGAPIFLSDNHPHRVTKRLPLNDKSDTARLRVSRYRAQKGEKLAKTG